MCMVYKYDTKEEMDRHIEEMEKQGYEVETFSDNVSIFTVEYKKHF